MKQCLREAAQRARYTSRRGLGERGFADYHVDAFMEAVWPEVALLIREAELQALRWQHRCVPIKENCCKLGKRILAKWRDLEQYRKTLAARRQP
jgi:hypothetical protein